jgi:hypothetical protein
MFGALGRFPLAAVLLLEDAESLWMPSTAPVGEKQMTFFS